MISRRFAIAAILATTSACASGTASIGALNPSGEAFQSMDPGYTADFVSNAADEGFSWGTGIGLGYHPAPDGFEDDTYIGTVFFEPRYSFGGEYQRVVPFVHARLGGSLHSWTAYNTPDAMEEVSADVGVLGGGGGGATFYFKPGLGVQGQVAWYNHRIFPTDDTKAHAESLSGGKTVFSVGLSWRR